MSGVERGFEILLLGMTQSYYDYPNHKLAATMVDCTCQDLLLPHQFWGRTHKTKLLGNNGLGGFHYLQLCCLVRANGMIHDDALENCERSFREKGRDLFTSGAFCFVDRFQV